LDAQNHTGGDGGIASYAKNLYVPSFIGSILNNEGIALKKFLGQNFLINRDIARRLFDYAQLDGSDTVLEIGPGLGTLTFALAQRVKRVIAVELDRGLARYLENKIKEFSVPNIDIVHRDFMKLSSSDFAALSTADKVVSNLPYSIGIRALLKIIDDMNSIQSITGTVQKEIAMRLTANPGMKEYAYVSVAAQCAADIHVPEKSIAPENFFPRPEVDSAIISLVMRPERDRCKTEFRDIVRAGFSNRRKNLVNNLLRLGFGMSKKQLQDIVKHLFHNEHVRAQQLAVEDFMRLTECLLHERNAKDSP